MPPKTLFLRASELSVQSFSPASAPPAVSDRDTTDPCKPGPTLKLGSTCLFSPFPCV